MRITIESTPCLTTIDGVPVRLWEGVTESGIACKVFVRLLAVREEADRSAFDRELREIQAPGVAGPRAVDMRFLLP
jgi:hypothetical protein